MSNSKNIITHIGFGAFHRAHQLVYAQDLADNFGSDWRYCEISLYNTDHIQALRDQQYRYAVLEQDAQKNTLIDINIVRDALHPTLDSVEKVIDQLASSDTKIISLTITEKGYFYLHESKGIDLDNHEIQNDLDPKKPPKTAIGYIVRALDARRKKATGNVSLLSCDNLQHNGAILSSVIYSFAKAFNPELGPWIDKHVSFPATMVDRIVPAMTDVSLQLLNQHTTQQDRCGVVCEPFKQWVIEDNFAAGRPAWEKSAVQLVEDVAPFETMKLRLLNGAHSFLAYLGSLANYKTISDAINDPLFREAAQRLMLDEQASTLDLPDNIDVADYINKLLQRFSNPKLQHLTSQIAMDGSQKITQRFLPSVVQHLCSDRLYPITTLAIAGWIRYVMGETEDGRQYLVSDPMANTFVEIKQTYGISEQSAYAVLRLPTIFPTELIEHSSFVDSVINSFNQLCNEGAKNTLATLLHKNATVA